MNAFKECLVTLALVSVASSSLAGESSGQCRLHTDCELFVVGCSIQARAIGRKASDASSKQESEIGPSAADAMACFIDPQTLLPHYTAQCVEKICLAVKNVDLTKE